MKVGPKVFEFTSEEQQTLRRMIVDQIDSFEETVELFMRNNDDHYVATFQDQIDTLKNILDELTKYGR